MPQTVCAAQIVCTSTISRRYSGIQSSSLPHRQTEARGDSTSPDAGIILRQSIPVLEIPPHHMPLEGAGIQNEVADEWLFFNAAVPRECCLGGKDRQSVQVWQGLPVRVQRLNTDMACPCVEMLLDATLDHRLISPGNHSV